MADKEIAVYLIETDKKALEGCEAAVWVWDPRDGDLEDGKPLPEAAFPAV